MNTINLADILIAKRRDKGITQEELAAYMGVSGAAVSKWEKNLSYPDITLLPQLAAYFNISVDDLLGYSPQMTTGDILKLCKKLSADFVSNPFDEVLTECREIVRKYYSCFPLLYHMALLLLNHHYLVKDKENQTELLEEAKALCSHVAAESGDAMLSKDALLLQSFCALVLETPNDIFGLIGEAVRFQGDISEAILISQAYQLCGNHEKAIAVSQQGMYMHLLSLINTMTYHITLPEVGFEAAETAFNRAVELIRVFNMKELYWNAAAKLYAVGILMYCKNNQPEQALRWLEEYAELCLSTTFPVEFRGDSFFTDVRQWLADECYDVLPYDTKMVKSNMLASLTVNEDISRVLKDEPRYKEIVQKLTDFINMEEK